VQLKFSLLQDVLDANYQSTFNKRPCPRGRFIIFKRARNTHRVFKARKKETRCQAHNFCAEIPRTRAALSQRITVKVVVIRLNSSERVSGRSKKQVSTEGPKNVYLATRALVFRARFESFGRCQMTFRCEPKSVPKLHHAAAERALATVQTPCFPASSIEKH
jgi:hypothetical protein